MSDYTPHPDDVTLVERLLEDWFGHDEPTQRQDATDFLAAVGPAIQARALRQAADEIDRGPDIPLRPSVFSELLREWAVSP